MGSVMSENHLSRQTSPRNTQGKSRVSVEGHDSLLLVGGLVSLRLGLGKGPKVFTHSDTCQQDTTGCRQTPQPLRPNSHQDPWLRSPGIWT